MDQPRVAGCAGARWVSSVLGTVAVNARRAKALARRRVSSRSGGAERFGAALVQVGSFEARSDNSFALHELRNGVVVAGVTYNDVAVVRVDQRAWSGAVAGACPYTVAATAQDDVNSFWLAPGVGHLVNFGYAAARDANGMLLFPNGAFDVRLTFGEAVKRMCTRPAPQPQYDWQLAFNAGLTAGASAPAPCP